MQEKDFKWFLDNFTSLYEKYGLSFVAIKDAKVIGVYKTFAEGVNETRKTEADGTFIVQQLGPDSSAYTVKVATALI
ncbi:MAG: hypothetical protein Q4E99_02140 [Bacillota bacterium]|nr:hypothetical protein [Bacillota bacterium]